MIRSFVLFFALIWIANAMAGNAVIFKGPYGKLLPASGLEFKDNKRILSTTATPDPTTTATGSIWLSDIGEIYQNIGGAWAINLTGSSPLVTDLASRTLALEGQMTTESASNSNQDVQIAQNAADIAAISVTATNYDAVVATLTASADNQDAQIAAIQADYVSDATLTATLAGFVDFVSLGATLSNYVLDTTLTATLAGFYDKTTADATFVALNSSPTINGTVTAVAFVGDGSGLTNLPGGGGGVSSVTGVYPVTSSGGANPQIGIGTSSLTSDGQLAKEDFQTFSNKQDSTLAQNKIWVGDATNTATPVGACAQGEVLKYQADGSLACDSDSTAASASAGSYHSWHFHTWAAAGSTNTKIPIYSEFSQRKNVDSLIQATQGATQGLQLTILATSVCNFSLGFSDGGPNSVGAIVVDTPDGTVSPATLSATNVLNLTESASPSFADSVSATGVFNTGEVISPQLAVNSGTNPSKHHFTASCHIPGGAGGGTTGAVSWEYVTHGNNLASSMTQSSANNPVIFATANLTSSSNEDLITINHGAETRFIANQPCTFFFSAGVQASGIPEVRKNGTEITFFRESSSVFYTTSTIVPIEMDTGDYITIQMGSGGASGTEPFALDLTAVQFNADEKVQYVTHKGTGNDLLNNAGNNTPIKFSLSPSFTATSGDDILDLDNSCAVTNATCFTAKETLYLTFHIVMDGNVYYEIKKGSPGSTLQFLAQAGVSNETVNGSTSIKLTTNEYVWIEVGASGGGSAPTAPVRIRAFAHTAPSGSPTVEFTNHYALGSTLITNSINTALKFGNNFGVEDGNVMSVSSTGLSTLFTCQTAKCLALFNFDSYGPYYYRLYKNASARNFSGSRSAINNWQVLAAPLVLDQGDNLEIYNGITAATNTAAQVNVNMVAIELEE